MPCKFPLNAQLLFSWPDANTPPPPLLSPAVSTCNACNSAANEWGFSLCRYLSSFCCSRCRCRCRRRHSDVDACRELRNWPKSARALAPLAPPRKPTPTATLSAKSFSFCCSSCCCCLLLLVSWPTFQCVKTALLFSWQSTCQLSQRKLMKSIFISLE